MLLRLVRCAHAWVMLCTWQPFCRLLTLDSDRRKNFASPPRSCSLLQPADSPHTDCFIPNYKSLFVCSFFTPLKLHHRGETATSVDYLSFLCYPMDIHCKADPFSAMHREYTEEVYHPKNVWVVASKCDRRCLHLIYKQLEILLLFSFILSPLRLVICHRFITVHNINSALK